MFKNFVYTGIGLVALTREKLQKSVDKLVTEDKISATEGRKLVDDFLKTTETKRNEFEGQVSSTVNNVVKRFSFVSSKEVDSLKKRIEVLEDALGTNNEPVEDAK